MTMRSRSVVRRPCDLSALALFAVLALVPGCGDDESAASPAPKPADYGPPELDDDLPGPLAEGRAPTPPMG